MKYSYRKLDYVSIDRPGVYFIKGYDWETGEFFYSKVICISPGAYNIEEYTSWWERVWFTLKLKIKRVFF